MQKGQDAAGSLENLTVVIVAPLDAGATVGQKNDSTSNSAAKSNVRVDGVLGVNAGNTDEGDTKFTRDQYLQRVGLQGVNVHAIGIESDPSPGAKAQHDGVQFLKWGSLAQRSLPRLGDL